VDYSVDILGAAGEESGAEKTVRNFGGGSVVVLQVEER
jgi:hypothetical protein